MARSAELNRVLNERDVLTLAAARRSDFDDWHLISEIAAKIALCLPWERFETFFASHTRDLIRMRNTVF